MFGAGLDEAHSKIMQSKLDMPSSTWVVDPRCQSCFKQLNPSFILPCHESMKCVVTCLQLATFEHASLNTLSFEGLSRCVVVSFDCCVAQVFVQSSMQRR